MKRDLDEIEFTIFDTETTGLEPESGDRIIEIAGIKLKGNKKIDIFHSLVNPHRPVSKAAYLVNGITQDMLKDAPSIEPVLSNFLDFIQDTCIASYNVAFDLGFLKQELKLSGLNLPKEIIGVDILTMARRLLPNLQRYALWFVAKSLGIRGQQRHRAFCDVEITLQVFNKLKGVLKAKGITDFADFLNLFGLNVHFLDNLNNQKIAKIQEAMERGVKLKIRYLSQANAEVSQREVIPKEIKEEKQHKYLVGYCYLRNEERTFRIDGILHLEIV